MSDLLHGRSKYSPRYGDFAKDIEKVMAWVIEDKDTSARFHAMRVLAQVAPNSAVDRMIALLRDEDAQPAKEKDKQEQQEQQCDHDYLLSPRTFYGSSVGADGWQAPNGAASTCYGCVTRTTVDRRAATSAYAVYAKINNSRFEGGSL